MKGFLCYKKDGRLRDLAVHEDILGEDLLAEQPQWIADLIKFDPNQPRDETGKWTVGGGASAVGKPGPRTGVRLKPSRERAWTGQTNERARWYTSQDAGKLGERIIQQYMQSQGGAFKDARPAGNIPNYAVDIIGDHELVEAKAGQVSTGMKSARWRLSIGEPGVKESNWLANASEGKKAIHNRRKQDAIVDRKEKVLREANELLKSPIKKTTYTTILDPDRKIADIYKFDGWHEIIWYKSQQAQQAYVGSYNYSASRDIPESFSPSKPKPTGPRRRRSWPEDDEEMPDDVKAEIEAFLDNYEETLRQDIMDYLDNHPDFKKSDSQAIIRAQKFERAKERALQLLKFDPDQPRDEQGRWTSGGGGGGDAGVSALKPKPGSRPSKTPISAKEARTAADSVAKKMGIDPKLISIKQSGGVETVKGKRNKTWAEFNHKTGRISVYPNNIPSSMVLYGEKTTLDGIITHEAMHLKFQRLKDKALSGSGEDYPSPAFEREWRNAFSGVRETTFANSDGVSGYSKAFWDDWKKQVRQDSPWADSTYEHAVHETLAEMARIKEQTGNFPRHVGSDKRGNAWRRLYNTIEKLYTPKP